MVKRMGVGEGTPAGVLGGGGGRTGLGVRGRGLHFPLAPAPGVAAMKVLLSRYSHEGLGRRKGAPPPMWAKLGSPQDPSRGNQDGPMQQEGSAPSPEGVAGGNVW